MTLYGKYYINNIESIKDRKNRFTCEIQLKLALCLLKTEVMENTLPSTTGSADCVYAEQAFPDYLFCLQLQVLRHESQGKTETTVDRLHGKEEKERKKIPMRVVPQLEDTTADSGTWTQDWEPWGQNWEPWGQDWETW